MRRCVDGTRDVTYCRCCTWMFSYADIISRFTYLVSDTLTDLSRGRSLWFHCGGKLRTAKQFSCTTTTLLPVWTNEGHGFLATEVVASLWKVLHVPWNVLRMLKSDPPSSAKMDGPWVKCVTRTLCSVTVLVRCFSRHPPLPFCSILPKYEKESANPSPLSLLSCNLFSQLSHLVAVRVLLLYDLFLQVRIIRIAA